MQCLYETLQVSPNASMSVVRAAYRCLAQLHHPDKRLANQTSERMMVQINLAYAVLSDADRRRQYDQSQGIAQAFIERRADSYKPMAAAKSQQNPNTQARPFAFRPLT